MHKSVTNVVSDQTPCCFILDEGRGRNKEVTTTRADLARPPRKGWDGAKPGEKGNYFNYRDREKKKLNLISTSTTWYNYSEEKRKMVIKIIRSIIIIIGRFADVVVDAAAAAAASALANPRSFLQRKIYL